VILRCNYEEISALRHGAQAFLERVRTEGAPPTLPPDAHSEVDALIPRLVGDITISTLAELRSVEVALEGIVVALRAQMENAVTTTHAADEHAVAAYFEFAHALTVLHRVRELGTEMEALIELATGEAVTPMALRDFIFPD
jgi:hypothetical protein